MPADSSHPVNSREWWEEYFVEDWDAYGGSEQTRYFMQRVLTELPAPDVEFLRSKPLTILDWGCAFGEGVELLARAFPQSRVVGLDFASTAIDQARQRHADREFIFSADGEIPGKFDVIVTSNCLEHLEFPLERMKAHLRSCEKMYIALVPFNEFPLSEYHRSQFKEESFPNYLGSFVRIVVKRIDADEAYWNGMQLLVIYGSQSYVRERAALDHKGSEQQKWDLYYADLPLFEPDEATQAFAAELVDRFSELLPQGAHILEAGCGGGWQSLALARSGKFRVSLMDFSREALNYARRLFEREQVQAEFILGDVFTKGDPQFDLVFNAGVLEHYTLEEQAEFLRGMASRSRNHVLALVPNRLCYWYWLWRIQESAQGKWPYGKEVPLIDLSAAFEAAGLRFLGEAFMGGTWTEVFINNLPGLDPALRDSILEAHRSPLIADPQKCYLLAALGSVLPEASTKAFNVPPIWSASPVLEDLHKAEMHAALADALALRIGAEQSLNQLRARETELEQAIQALSISLAEKDRNLEEASARVTEKGQEVRELSTKLSDKDKDLRQMSARMTEKEELVESLSEELVEKQTSIAALSILAEQAEQTAQSLSSELAEKEQSIESLASQLAEKEQNTQLLMSQSAANRETIRVLSEQLSAKDYELRRVTNTLGWRMLSRYGRIKYRYLLPVYRALGLPPYDRKGVDSGRASPVSLPDMADTVQTNDPSHASDVSATRLAVREQEGEPQNEASACDIICFPIIDWDFRFQRPQQLMSRFAAAGHRVFYVSQTFRSSGEPYTIEQKRSCIYEVSLRGPSLNVYTDRLDRESCDELFTSLNALRRELAVGAAAAFVQLPFWWPLAKYARDEFAWSTIYDCMDYHAGFSTNRNKMLDQEEELLQSADLVIVSSAFLENEARRHNSRVVLARNACDYEHFAKATTPENARPVVGYYGAIADWFDADLVADLAQRRRDWDFLLVGSTFSADLSRLSKLPNVSLPGEQHYSEIPGWLSKMDVALIPFKRNALTEATNPVKAYEILAAGKPLVSVAIPEVAALTPLVRLAATAEEFEKEISEALNEDDPELIARRRAFAAEHTWEKRYDTVAPAVREAFPKASIIVVTFNNLQLNRLCLESIYANTEWPNFEVIVVDNASSDGTPGYLETAEKRFPNLRIALNSSNLGFAAANNIGLKLATGDYLVLLNNDTVVTRGWMSALIRHLHVNRKIGMIGPVSNAISNEAKVEVDYTRLEDMPAWAADYVGRHDGEIFPIPMLAMFCVAIRREVFEKVGYLDERFGIGMFEDDDYCRRLEDAGYELRCARDSFVHHWQRASFRLIGEEEYLRVYEENQKKFHRKWSGGRPPASDLTPYADQLKEVVAKIESRKGAVVFLPSIGWNIHLFQRPHHLAREFARQGYVSIFDSSNSQDDVRGFKEIEPNLYLYHGPQEILGQIPRPILWAFPYNFDRKDSYAVNARTVYDWIDDLEVFPYDRAFLERNHRRALKEAQIVTSVARRLHERALQSRSDAVYLPNAVEYERFAVEASPPPDAELDGLLKEGKPIAGYYGALANWFDYKLLDEAAALRPDWNFVLIGQMLDQSLNDEPLLNRRNVRWVGPRDYKTLPGYLSLFDVAMIPFAINNITLSTSPLKLYEYLAGGKPVITTPMPECEAISEVLIVRDAEGLAAALDTARAKGADAGFRARVRAIARENSWARRVEQIVGSLEDQHESATSTSPR